MTDAIYLLRPGGDDLTRVTQAPYEKEADLQRLLGCG